MFLLLFLDESKDNDAQCQVCRGHYSTDVEERKKAVWICCDGPECQSALVPRLVCWLQM